MHELNFRWGGLDWVPRRGSDVEFCAAPYGPGPRPKTPLHKQDVSELLKALSETVPRQTFMQKLLWKLGWSTGRECPAQVLKQFDLSFSDRSKSLQVSSP